MRPGDVCQARWTEPKRQTMPGELQGRSCFFKAVFLPEEKLLPKGCWGQQAGLASSKAQTGSRVSFLTPTVWISAVHKSRVSSNTTFSSSANAPRERDITWAFPQRLSSTFQELKYRKVQVQAPESSTILEVSPTTDEQLPLSCVRNTFSTAARTKRSNPIQ